jgi:hypothetical protein
MSEVTLQHEKGEVPVLWVELDFAMKTLRCTTLRADDAHSKVFHTHSNCLPLISRVCGAAGRLTGQYADFRASTPSAYRGGGGAQLFLAVRQGSFRQMN